MYVCVRPILANSRLLPNVVMDREEVIKKEDWNRKGEKTEQTQVEKREQIRETRLTFSFITVLPP